MSSRTDALIARLAALDGYTDMRELGEAGIVGIEKFLFTHAILADLCETGYGDRWCYSTYAAAKAALDAWDGTGEPTGWHRHVDTGRRRDEHGVQWVEY